MSAPPIPVLTLPDASSPNAATPGAASPDSATPGAVSSDTASPDAATPPTSWARTALSRTLQTALLKQLPSTLAYLTAVVLTFTVPGLRVTNVPGFITSAVCLGVATALALLLTARPHRFESLTVWVPVLDLVGFGLLRDTTGIAYSLFGPLMLIPVVWLAALPGKRHVVTVAVITLGTILFPFILEPPSRPAELLRAVITPLVYTTVAAVINELSRQQRMRVVEAEERANERTLAAARQQQSITALRESEERYRGLLENFESLWAAITSQAVIAVDATGTIDAWNTGASRMFGLSEKEALAGMRFEHFVPLNVLDSLATEATCKSANAVTGTAHGTAPPQPGTGLHTALVGLFSQADEGVAAEWEIELETAGQARFPARITVTRRNDATGAQRGYLLVVTDETRALEVTHMKDQFVGMISHELRTPLSSIVGFIDLLKDDPEQPLSEEQRDFVEIIERNAKRLLSLVGDLLFTAQVESGKFPVVRAPLDARALVEVAVASARPNAATAGVTLDVEVPDYPTVLQLDAGRIGQALDNLISNAIKFTPRGGSVSVSLREVGNNVVLAVRDTGVGIPEDEQAQLFTRFFRASTATNNAVPGVGLGLNITNSIVIAHGGRMSVKSSPGGGTEFAMILPVAPITSAIPIVRA